MTIHRQPTTDNRKSDDAAVHVRWLIRRDLPEVLAIERDSFPSPWTEEDFVRCLRRCNCIGMVAEREQAVVGHMVYALHRTAIELLNFAVAAEHRRRGVGRAMMAKLQAKLSSQRRRRIWLVVSEWNYAGQLFFRATGFRAMAVQRGHFCERVAQPEDGYRMVYRLSESLVPRP